MTHLLRRTLILLTAAVTTAGVVAGLGAPVSAAPTGDHGGGHQAATIRVEEHHDHSPTLSSMPAAPLRDEQAENEPIHRMPNVAKGHHADPVVQSTLGPAAPTLGTGFDG